MLSCFISISIQSFKNSLSIKDIEQSILKQTFYKDLFKFNLILTIINNYSLQFLLISEEITVSNLITATVYIFILLK